jgi:hypothetical protein
MAFSGDVEVFNEPGAVIKSAALDPQARPGVYDRFAVPVASDIGALQGGAGITLAALDEAEVADLAEGGHTLIRVGDTTYKVSLDVLNVAIGAGGRAILTREDLGLAGDGVTDDAPALQAACELWSSRGGAGFMLKAEANQSFRFEGTVRGASNISILFVSPHTVTSTSRLMLCGELQAVTDADRFLLSADTAAGDTTAQIDTSPHGGAPLNSYLAVGDTIRLTGLRDSAGTPLEEHEARATAVTSTTVTFNPALAHAFKATYDAGAYEAAQGVANRTFLSKIVAARFSSNVAAGANLIPIEVTDLGKIVAGDFVMVFSEARCSDIAGTSTVYTHVEMARVASSVPGDAAASVRLSRRLERSYTTAKNARLIKVNPIVNASIQGATVEFTQAPESGNFVHPFEVRYGVDCILGSPAVPNTDDFGTRGAGFRLYRSLSCQVENPTLRDSRYVGDGEGNGVAFDHCTDCVSRGGTFDGARHAVLFAGATNCVAESPVIQDPRHSPLDFHGQNEVGCRVINPTVTAGTTYEAIAGKAPAGMVFGNPSHLAGSHRCGIVGGRLTGFKHETGAAEPCIRFFPPSTGCFVLGTEFHDISTLLGHEDVDGFGTLVASGHRLEDVSVDGCGDWLINLDGRANGASVDTLSDMKISGLIGRNLNKLMLAQFVTELEILHCDLDEITVDASRTYALEADTCPNLTVIENIFKGAGRGLRLTSCAGSLGFRVAGNKFMDLTASTTYFDAGSNSGIWRENLSFGFTESATGRTSVITEGPRAAGVVTMADDTAFSFIPLRTHGIVQVFSHNSSTFYGVATYRALSSGHDCDLITGGSTTANVEVTTGALAGTTGTDAKFTISAHTNGRVYFENRLGSSVNIDFSTS